MIVINNLSKIYGKRVLFQNLSLTINPKERIGLIGPNGAGKSTFFALLLGESESTAGTIQCNKNIRIGYLPQESSFHSERTVLNELIEGDRTILALTKEKEELENKNEAGSYQYGEVLHELETLGYFELEHRAEKILMGLGFKERDFTRPISNLSGGWQMRTLLAKLLTVNYDILLLDEPTNYLDLNAAIWLKDYLSGFDGTFIMISHDKDFLNDVTNYTLVLENGMISKVKGSYEHYEQIKAERRLFLERQFKEQEKKREQLEEFVARFHAQPNKAASVRSKRTTLEKMEAEKQTPTTFISAFWFAVTRMATSVLNCCRVWNDCSRKPRFYPTSRTWSKNPGNSAPRVIGVNVVQAVAAGIRRETAAAPTALLTSIYDSPSTVLYYVITLIPVPVARPATSPQFCHVDWRAPAP